MGGNKLSQTQRGILEFLAAGHAPYLAYYGGPRFELNGDPSAGYYWRQYNRKRTPPKVPGNSVNGLIRRDLLRYETAGDYVITPRGRAALGAGT